MTRIRLDIFRQTAGGVSQAIVGAFSMHLHIDIIINSKPFTSSMLYAVLVETGYCGAAEYEALIERSPTVYWRWPDDVESRGFEGAYAITSATMLSEGDVSGKSRQRVLYDLWIMSLRKDPELQRWICQIMPSWWNGIKDNIIDDDGPRTTA